MTVHVLTVDDEVRLCLVLPLALPLRIQLVVMIEMPIIRLTVSFRNHKSTSICV